MAESHDQSSESLAPGADPLSDVLRTVRLTGALFFQSDAFAPWVVDIPEAATFASLLQPSAQQIISYHIVILGSCWVSVGGAPPERLETGDILLVPHGDAYVMSSAPGMRDDDPVGGAQAFFRGMRAARPPSIRVGGDGPDSTRVLCGFLGCDARPFNPALATLPRMVHLRRSAGPSADRLGHLIEFALAESREQRSGGQCVLLRLSELMFVEVVRRYLADLPDERKGWLAGLRDPVVGGALALLHARASEGWTLDKLAREAGVSRSTLAERFAQFVGQPPMQYLMHWRIQLAARLLADGDAKVGAVGLDIGYESEAAFSRAFKKIVGVSPAAWRKRST